MQVREKRFEAGESRSGETGSRREETGSRCRVSRSSFIFSSLLAPRSSILLALLLILLAVSSCAGPPAARHTSRTPSASVPDKTLPESPPSTPPAPAPRVPSPQDQVTEPPQEATPRSVASLRLTEQARNLLEAGNTDQAIRTLERAMNLNPSNGQNFYYLSEAWLKKKNYRQAEEFNRLAAIHLKTDASWTARVAEQAERIKRGKQ